MHRFLDLHDMAPRDRAGAPLIRLAEENALRGVARGLTRGTGRPEVDRSAESMPFPPARVLAREVHGGFRTGGERVVMHKARADIVLRFRYSEVVNLLTGNRLVCYNSISIYTEGSTGCLLARSILAG